MITISNAMVEIPGARHRSSREIKRDLGMLSNNWDSYHCEDGYPTSESPVTNSYISCQT